MRLDIVTIFPEYFAPLQLSLVGKAINRGLVAVGVHDLRRWTHDRHRTVDDTPYGGGAGMVMKPDPIFACVDAVQAMAEPRGRVVLLTPQGRLLNHDVAAGEARMRQVSAELHGVAEALFGMDEQRSS